MIVQRWTEHILDALHGWQMPHVPDNAERLATYTVQVDTMDESYLRRAYAGITLKKRFAAWHGHH